METAIAIVRPELTNGVSLVGENVQVFTVYANINSVLIRQAITAYNFICLH